MIAVLQPPKPDPALDVFRGGVAALRRDGAVAGHVATTVKEFWAPLSFSRRRQWWVWYIVVWANGDRERPQEDYPPWTIVREMQSNAFTWDEDADHRGEYTLEWLPEDARGEALSRLGVEWGDF